jgi:glycosyltransferase involved in cell wall biosynthesis
MVMSQPVILLVIPNLGNGGAQKVFRQQLAFYSSRFRTIAVVFNRDGFTDEDNRLQNVVSMDVPGGETWLTKLQFFRRRIRKLRAIKNENGVTLSISHLEGADYVNCLSKGNEKVICWVHGTKSHDREIAGTLGVVRRKLMIPNIYRKSNLIVTVSERIAEELKNDFGLEADKVFTIRNVVDVRNILTLSQVPIEDDVREFFRRNLVIITHSRLARQKNIEALLMIYSRIRGKAKLVVVGDGEEKGHLLKTCSDAGLRVHSGEGKTMSDADVIFLGHKANPFPYLRLATLYTITSRWEGFPLSVCEALVCGLPVIASDCYTGPRELIMPELGNRPTLNDPASAPCGMLMPLADSPEKYALWAEVISKALDDGASRERWARAASRMSSQLDEKNIESEWLRIVNQ